jgi:hypothetical protein
VCHGISLRNGEARSEIDEGEMRITLPI